MDLAIIGGGLSGSLLALALQKFHPEINFALFEKGSDPCGNHTWCFHEGDVPAGLAEWIQPLTSKSWDGYDVHFPKHSRTLAGKYNAIKSEDLSKIILQKLGAKFKSNSELLSMERTGAGVELKFRNETVKSRAVILCTGWRSTLQPSQLGWQKFVGLEVEFAKPHGLTRPILKDVLQEQTDGYRFIYTLPFSATSALIEDTYYSNSPELNVPEIEDKIKAYAIKKNWQISKVVRREVGSLPLFLDLPAEDLQESWPRLGAGSQFVNPVTGYTLPLTLRAISDLMKLTDFSLEGIRKTLHETYHSNRPNLHYLALLNRMMFLAAKPEKRYLVLERFYRLQEPLIERFYAANLTLGDRVRILSGKPPVNIFSAVRALTQDLTHSSR